MAQKHAPPPVNWRQKNQAGTAAKAAECGTRGRAAFCALAQRGWPANIRAGKLASGTQRGRRSRERSGLKAGLPGGWPGRYGVPPLEWVAAHEGRIAARERPFPKEKLPQESATGKREADRAIDGSTLISTGSTQQN